MLADDFFLVSLFVEQLGYSDVWAEEVFKDRICMSLKRLRLHGRLFYGRCMIEIAVLDVVIAGYSGLGRCTRTVRRIPQHRRLSNLRIILRQERFWRILAIGVLLSVGRNSHMLGHIGWVLPETLFKPLHEIHEIFHRVLLVTYWTRVAWVVDHVVENVWWVYIALICI